MSLDNRDEAMAQLREKISIVIGRVGVTDMAVDIIIDLVARYIERADSVKSAEVTKSTTKSTKVTKSTGKNSKTARKGGKGVFLDLDSPEEIPDPSKPLLQGIPNIMGETGEVKPSPFFRALRQFCEIWRTRHGVWYEPSPADKNHLGRLISSLEPEMLKYIPMAFNAYLADTSPFVAQEQRHSLRYFCSSGGFNKYRAVKSTTPFKQLPYEPSVSAPFRGWAATNGRRQSEPTELSELLEEKLVEE